MNIEKSLEKFLKMPKEYTLTVDSDLVAREMNRINEKYDIDISYIIIMVSTEDLQIDKMANFIQVEFEMDINQARIVADEIKKYILEPLKKRLEFINANPQKNISIADEKRIILKIFKERLVQEIKNHAIIRNAVNQRIFYCLLGDLDFRKRIEAVIYENEELLTSKQIIIEDEDKEDPTISNWIRYFIKDSGSAMFDNIVLSKFITNARYVVVLSEEEKNLLIKVLKTYRNIKFFPASMPNDDVEKMTNWTILPIENIGNEAVDKEENKVTEEQKDVIKVPVEKEEKVKAVEEKKDITKELVEKEEKDEEVEKEKVVKALTEKEKKLQEYKEELEKYTPGSIESEIIKEEMKNFM